MKHFVILRTGKITIRYEVPIEDIITLDFMKENAVLLIVRLRSKQDFLIETFKRFEVIRFILQACEESFIKKIRIREVEK